MKVRDLKKLLDSLGPETNLWIKGFPPDMDEFEIRYDISEDKMVIIPAESHPPN